MSVNLNNQASENILSEYRDLLSIEDLSEIFGASKNTLYKSIRHGDFGTPIKLGRAYKIPKIYVVKKFFSDYR